MPVIINDFEVDVEPPPSSGESAVAAPPATSLTAADIAQINRYLTERQARLHAD